MDSISKYNVIDGNNCFLIIDSHNKKEAICDYTGEIWKFESVMGYIGRYLNEFICLRRREIIYQGEVLIDNVVYAKQIYDTILFVRLHNTNVNVVMLYDLKSCKPIAKISLENESTIYTWPGRSSNLHILSDRVIWIYRGLMHIMYLSGEVKSTPCTTDMTTNTTMVGYIKYHIGDDLNDYNSIHYDVNLFSGSPGWVYTSKNAPYHGRSVISDDIVMESTNSRGKFVLINRSGDRSIVELKDDYQCWCVKISDTGHTLELYDRGDSVEYDILTDNEVKFIKREKREFIGDAYLLPNGEYISIYDKTGRCIVTIRNSGIYRELKYMSQCNVYLMPNSKETTEAIVTLLDTYFKGVHNIPLPVLNIVAEYV